MRLAQGLLPVKSAVLTVRQSLPVNPNHRTFSLSVGGSQRCQRTLRGDVDPHQTPRQRSPLPLEEAVGEDHPTMLPFTLEQFLNVFATYNKAIWPAQIAAYVLGAIAVAAFFGRALPLTASSQPSSD